jgi:hypothetical protein
MNRTKDFVFEIHDVQILRIWEREKNLNAVQWVNTKIKFKISMYVFKAGLNSKEWSL